MAAYHKDGVQNGQYSHERHNFDRIEVVEWVGD